MEKTNDTKSKPPRPPPMTKATTTELKQTSLTAMFTKPDSFITVSIIGTAGRNEDGEKMTADLFDKMCQTAYRVITEEWKLSPQRVMLVSGGAAWADHVAVQLYNQEQKFAGLTVHLPCAMEEETKNNNTITIKMVDNGSKDWRVNPGRLMNQLHDGFRVKTKRSTLMELSSTKARGAIHTVSKGFHARNDRVAKSAYILAFTWGQSNGAQSNGAQSNGAQSNGAQSNGAQSESAQSDNCPKDGGTKYTWDKAKTVNKRHVSLYSL